MNDQVNIQMTKKRSPHRITIKTDLEDSHFSVVELTKIRTGEIKATHYILTSDRLTWVSFFESDGFRITKQL